MTSRHGISLQNARFKSILIRAFSIGILAYAQPFLAIRPLFDLHSSDLDDYHIARCKIFGQRDAPLGPNYGSEFAFIHCFFH